MKIRATLDVIVDLEEFNISDEQKMILTLSKSMSKEAVALSVQSAADRILKEYTKSGYDIQVLSADILT